MNKKWVCVTKDFENFTYGKVYEGELNSSGTILNVTNDVGNKPLPSYYRPWSKRPYDGIRYFYFLSLEDWRERKINKVLNEL